MHLYYIARGRPVDLDRLNVLIDNTFYGDVSLHPNIKQTGPYVREVRLLEVVTPTQHKEKVKKDLKEFNRKHQGKGVHLHYIGKWPDRLVKMGTHIVEGL